MSHDIEDRLESFQARNEIRHLYSIQRWIMSLSENYIEKDPLVLRCRLPMFPRGSPLSIESHRDVPDMGCFLLHCSQTTIANPQFRFKVCYRPSCASKADPRYWDFSHLQVSVFLPYSCDVRA